MSILSIAAVILTGVAILRIIKAYKETLFELQPLVLSLLNSLVILTENTMYESYFAPFTSMFIETLIYFSICLFFINIGSRLKNVYSCKT